MSSIMDITFGIKDVVAIVMGAGTIFGAYYTIKRNDEKHTDSITNLKKMVEELDQSVEERLMHAKNAKKANIYSIMQKIDKVELNVEKKETAIYLRLDEVKKEQKEDHSSLNRKVDDVMLQLNKINSSLSELNGYLKAKDKDK